MGLESEPEVVLMLAQHLHQLVIIVSQGLLYLLVGRVHLADGAFQACHYFVILQSIRFQGRLKFVNKRFKNYTQEKRCEG